MNNSWSICWRSGGTDNCKWHRTDNYPNETAARLVAGEIENMGYRAIVYITAQLDAIGMPEGWDAQGPLRGEMSPYLTEKAQAPRIGYPGAEQMMRWQRDYK